MCQRARSDILPPKTGNILPSRARDTLLCACDLLPLPSCRQGWLPTTEKRGFLMGSPRSPKPSAKVTEARAIAQRGKLDAQVLARRQQDASKNSMPKPSRGRKGQEDPLSKRRSATTVERAVADFLDDQEGGNHSAKTLEWHRTALGLFSRF